MKQVLIKISGGIIDRVEYYSDAKAAVWALSDYVKTMNIEKEDAAVYGPDEMTANAKDFLDEIDQYVDNSSVILESLGEQDRPVFIIGNPTHHLGFMVASTDDPLGYTDPAEALSELGQMRKEYGSHLKLYQVVPVKGPVALKADLKHHNADCKVENFDYLLVKEHLR